MLNEICELELLLTHSGNSDIFKGSMDEICKTYDIETFENIEIKDDEIYIVINEKTTILLFELFRRKLLDKNDFMYAMKSQSRPTIYKILYYFLNNLERLEFNDEFINLLDDIIYHKKFIDKIINSRSMEK